MLLRHYAESRNCLMTSWRWPSAKVTIVNGWTNLHAGSLYGHAQASHQRRKLVFAFFRRDGGDLG